MNYTNETNQDYFSGLVENRVSKIVSVAFSELGTCVIMLLTFMIIWYEKFGTSEYQTVINRINVKCWWLCLAYFSTVQQVDIFRYIFGTLPWTVCLLNVYAKFFFPMCLIIFLNFIVVTRYLFIFWIKNPCSLNDELLSIFISIWAFFSTFISQFVLMMMPGKEFPDVLFCSGVDPHSSLTQEYRNILGYTIFKIASIALHIVISIRIKIYKWTIAKEKHSYDPRTKVTWLFDMGKNSIISISESLIPAILVTLAILPKPPRQDMDLETFNQYPECLHEYYFTLIRPVFAVLVIIVSKIISDKYLQNVFVRELKDFFNNLIFAQRKK